MEVKAGVTSCPKMQNQVNLSVLPLDADMFGNVMRIYPVLIWDEAEATLIDTGFPGMFDQLMQTISKKGIPLVNLKRIIITHQDWDHIGTLPDIIKTWPTKVEVFAHSQEKPYIEGTLPNVKMTPQKIAARLEAMPAAVRPKAAKMFANLPTAQVDRTLEDGELLPFHGGIEVIHTPGHTPGHICLYVKAHRLLIAGDQFRVEDGRLQGPVAMYTPDMPTALQSLGKFAAYDIRRVICYHGGSYDQDVQKNIAELVAGK
jgi:glyoxylase-like metal-dependent hydrolase (beta-lactamase superfamily II)